MNWHKFSEEMPEEENRILVREAAGSFGVVVLLDDSIGYGKKKIIFQCLFDCSLGDTCCRADGFRPKEDWYWCLESDLEEDFKSSE